MYKLEDGTELTEEVRRAFKRGHTRAYIKFGNTIIDPNNYLINAQYKDEKADPETGEFIGITSMRELTIKLNNENNNFNLENQEIEYHLGAKVGNEYKYINFGKFIVQKPDNEEVNEEVTFTALDYMSKFDTDEAYESGIVFPTTLAGLAKDVCRQINVELGNTDFRNADMPILANPFVNGENPRTVLKSIAKLSFSCGYIGQDNKLYFGFDILGTEWETVEGIDEIEIDVSREQYVNNYIIEGNTYQDHVPTQQNPSEILGVGDLVIEGEHAGQYLINITNGEESYNIYLNEPLYKIGDVVDYIDFVDSKIYKNIGKIDSYNGEIISTPYISSTGTLSIGATVIYVLAVITNIYLSTENGDYIITENEDYIITE